MIKFNKHFMNRLLTFKDKNLLNIYVKLKLINRLLKYIKFFIHMFNNVNKTLVLQCKFRNIKILEYDLNIKKLPTFNT